MRITESRLRRIIRSVISESNLQSGEELVNKNINGHKLYIREKSVGYAVEIKFGEVKPDPDHVEYAIIASGGTEAKASKGFDVRVFYYKSDNIDINKVERRWIHLLSF